MQSAIAISISCILAGVQPRNFQDFLIDIFIYIYIEFNWARMHFIYYEIYKGQLTMSIHLFDVIQSPYE